LDTAPSRSVGRSFAANIVPL